MKEPFKLIVISSTDGFEHEIAHVQRMFEEGLELFHLRKPKFSTKKMRSYLEKIGSDYHSRIVIHSHHELCASFQLHGIHFTKKHLQRNFAARWLKTKYLKLVRKEITLSVGLHTISDLKTKNNKYDYVFLSPIFKSISKVGYSGTFNEDSLSQALKKTSYTVFAMGGVDEDKIERAMELGFSGAAVLGSIWKSKEPVEKFIQLQTRCRQAVNT